MGDFPPFFSKLLTEIINQQITPENIRKRHKKILIPIKKWKKISQNFPKFYLVILKVFV